MQTLSFTSRSHETRGARARKKKQIRLKNNRRPETAAEESEDFSPVALPIATKVDSRVLGMD